MSNHNDIDSIKGLWKSFNKGVAKRNLSKKQNTEIERVFYAGAVGIFTLIMELEYSAKDEKDLIKKLGVISKECADFITLAELNHKNQIPH